MMLTRARVSGGFGPQAEQEKRAEMHRKGHGSLTEVRALPLHTAKTLRGWLQL